MHSQGQLRGLAQTIAIAAVGVAQGLLVLALAGCHDERQRDQASTSAFWKAYPVVSSRTLSDFSLSRITKSDFENIEIRARIDMVTIPAPSGEHQQEFAHIEFPSLNAEQFAFLKKTYGYDRSRVQFISGEAYELTDFLPPTIQAIANTLWVVDRDPDFSPVYSNCFSMAYELARLSPDDVSFYIAPQDQIVERFNDTKYARKLAPGEMVEPLDVRLAGCEGPECTNGPIDIFHAITLIDENVYFEMDGFGSTPLRMRIQEPGPYPWAPTVVPDDAETRSRIGYFRFQAATARLPGPESLAGYDGALNSVPDTKAAFKSFALSFDNLGRAHLPDDSFIRTYRPDVGD